MTDDRPRPEYGEYATPEQQAAAMGKKYVPPAPEPDPQVLAAVLPQAYVARPQGYANRFITVFLLGLGALSLFSNIPNYLNLATAVKGAMAASLASTVQVPAAVNAAGIPVLIANVVIYAAAVLLSVFAIRRGRVSFYIPLVGFVVFSLVFGLIVGIYAPGYYTQLAH